MNHRQSEVEARVLSAENRPLNLEQFERALGLALWTILLGTLFYLGAQ